MDFSASKFCFLQIGVVYLASCVLAQFELDNMLQNGQMQVPAEQPQLNFGTFSGPGSSVESEKTQPFNTIGAGAVGTDTSTQTKPAQGVVTGSTTNPVNQVVQPPVISQQTDGNRPPILFNNNGNNNQGSNGKLPQPIQGDAQIPPEMGPLMQLLQAILSKHGMGRFGGGGPGAGFSPLEDGSMGGGFGGSFMGGPPRRIARIIILRKPRGQGGNFQGGYGGGFGGQPGGMGFMNQ